MTIGTFLGTNSTGWNELYNANLTGAVSVLYQGALVGWALVILFFLYQFMLWEKTRSPVLGFTTGVVFVGIYHIMTVPSITVGFMYLLLTVQLAAILYALIFK